MSPLHFCPSSRVFSYAASRSRRSWTMVGRGAWSTPDLSTEDDFLSLLDGSRALAPDSAGFDEIRDARSTLVSDVS
jgi:hypothetical protein